MHIASDPDSGDFVSIERADVPDDDIVVFVEVRSRGFMGRVDAWIQRAAWSAFCEQLRVLEERRQGEATVESISPNELRLTVRSIDRRGHMAIEGLVGYRGTRGEVRLTFSPMSFDESTLPTISKEARAIAAQRG